MNSLVGTRGLIRLILRRDRVLLPMWVLLLAIIVINVGSSIDTLYPTAADRMKYAATSGTNPTFLALYGPLYNDSLGGLVAQRLGFVPVVVGLIAILTVIRHTRTDEEAGRRELLGSTVVGRHAALAAALIVTGGANLVLALLIGIGMTAQDLPAAGSFALGLAFAAVGCAFAAVAGVTAQLTDGAGGARGIAITVLGGAFVVRLAADVGGEGNGLSWLGWLSPIGWAHRMRPFAGERWWLLALFAALVVVLAGAAVALSARRDVGAGVLPPRLGPAVASPSLRSPLALAWRLHRGLLLGWTAGFAALGVVYGSVADGVKDLVEDNPDLEKYFTRIGGESGLIDAYLASILSVLGIIAAGYAVQATLRLRAEETGQRAEPVLATGVGRIQWAASHLFFSLLGPVVVLAVSGLCVGVTHGLNSSDLGGQVPRVLGGAMVQVPAVWLLAGIAVALFGLLPRAAALAWAAVALFFILGQFGAALNLSQSAMDVSPFTHIPKIPGGDMSVAPLIWLLALTALLGIAGILGLRRRDIPIG